MKLQLLLIFLAVQLISCADKSRPGKSAGAAGTNDTSLLIWADTAQSTFRIFKDDSDGWVYKSSEISYKVLTFFKNPFGRHFDDVKQDTNNIA